MIVSMHGQKECIQVTMVVLELYLFSTCTELTYLEYMTLIARLAWWRATICFVVATETDEGARVSE